MKTNDCDMVKRKDNADGSIVENKTMADKFVLMYRMFYTELPERKDNLRSAKTLR